ncbi:hypothetical protein N0V85_006340 [Neurospora sp. IMI 360204]|nr:hypothetical protein N0V85_006340 [Neurospora sp. IMI 360204]
MPPKKKKPQVVPMPLFSRLPAEIQIMIFHEALRKPQIHFVKVTQDQSPRFMDNDRLWSVILKPRDKSADTSGYRLFDNIQDVALFSPIAAEVIRKNILKLHRLPISKNGSWMIDAATDLVVLEFDPDKSGSRVRLWHPRNRGYYSNLDVTAIRQQLEGIRKVAVVYGENQQPDAGSSESLFKCLHHHQRKHSSRKFCPEELLGLIYQLSHIEAVYFILKHRVNVKAVIDYAASYFSVPSATRNTFGFKTFYSTTRSYITVPLPSYEIGPVFHATWKAKDCIWPEDSPPLLVNAAREATMALPPDSRERQYVKHMRKLSYLGRALDHREEVWPLVAEMIRQMRDDQNTPLSPDWPSDPTPFEANSAQFRTLKQHHRLKYNLDNLTKERRDNLEFGMLLMVEETASCQNGKDKDVKCKAGGVNKKTKDGKSVA